jgi:NAD(P)-dependent dehydrogenase (short-subunit alcohol dehydrogenase family)
MNRLQNKVAIVTGFGSGIGQSCALLFAREGALVIGVDINPTSAQESLALAEQEGLSMDSITCDLTQPDQVRALVSTVMERYGRVDTLVNAGAFGAFQWIEDMDYERDWRKTMVGEIDIVFLLCQAAWPYLKKQGGSIVNFASANAHVAFEPSPALAHCAGKGAVLAMTRQLALEGGPFQIRANTISPGLVETSATQFPLENIEGFKDAVARQSIIKRHGQPEDIAWAAVYLASDEATWVTGADFNIDGGTTAL